MNTIQQPRFEISFRSTIKSSEFVWYHPYSLCDITGFSFGTNLLHLDLYFCNINKIKIEEGTVTILHCRR